MQTQEEFDLLQIHQASIGCISGKLEEWPCLIAALKRRGIVLPHWIHATFIVRDICKAIIEHEEN